jgi:hypothetical protein
VEEDEGGWRRINECGADKGGWRRIQDNIKEEKE